MRSGQMRERVDLQGATRGTDAIGSKTTTWAHVRYLWSRWEPIIIGSTDGLTQGARREVERYTVTVRYSASSPIRPGDHRLVWNGKPFAILSAPPSEKRDSVTLTVESGTGASG